MHRCGSILWPVSQTGWLFKAVLSQSTSHQPINITLWWKSLFHHPSSYVSSTFPLPRHSFRVTSEKVELIDRHTISLVLPPAVTLHLYQCLSDCLSAGEEGKLRIPFHSDRSRQVDLISRILVSRSESGISGLSVLTVPRALMTALNEVLRTPLDLCLVGKFRPSKKKIVSNNVELMKTI